MKRVIAVCLLFALSACAITDQKDMKASSRMSQRQLNSSGYDEAYMARVEQQASQRGVIVKWINPPKAPKALKAKKDGQ